jgi:hypothetical protein
VISSTAASAAEESLARHELVNKESPLLPNRQKAHIYDNYYENVIISPKSRIRMSISISLNAMFASQECMPRFRYSDVVFCERYGEVTLRRLSKGRIPWPMCRRRKVGATVLCGGLVDQVRRESGVAVQCWCGVGQDTVWKWRKALGVGRYTQGTRALQSDYANEPRMDAIRAKAWAKAGDPERRAKISAANRGRPVAPHISRPSTKVTAAVEQARKPAAR